MKGFTMASYFRFEVHHGDDNDNNISEFIMEAKNLEECWVRIQKDLEKRAKEAGITLDIDGDGESLTSMYYEYYDENGNDIADDDEIPNDSHGIPFHEDYYFQEEYPFTDIKNANIAYDQAESDMSDFHGRWNFDG